MKALLIEDDPVRARTICCVLEQAQYRMEITDYAQALLRARQNPYSVLLLQAAWPRQNSLQLCEELRRHRIPTPILIFGTPYTAEDRIRALDAGADDCLSEPFDVRELLARLRALVRRDSRTRARVIRIADLEIDTAERRAARAGHILRLSQREYELLEALAAHEGQVFSREAIQERVWMCDSYTSNTVDVFIKTLRKKIDAGYPTKLIHTVYGMGYTLRAPGEDSVY